MLADCPEIVQVLIERRFRPGEATDARMIRLEWNVIRADIHLDGSAVVLSAHRGLTGRDFVGWRARFSPGTPTDVLAAVCSVAQCLYPFGVPSIDAGAGPLQWEPASDGWTRR